MQAIVRRLQRATATRIALCSLIPIGEDPRAADPFQAAANRRSAECSALLQAIAREEAVSYLPVFERMHALILAAPGHACTRFDVLPFERAVFRQVVLRTSNDEIGRRNGWQCHRDGIHLNGRSGTLLPEVVQHFLEPPAGVDSPTQA
jgi:hypothetical protein